MGFEYRLKFSDSVWYPANRDRLASRVESLATFVRHVSEDEVWLKDSTGSSSWPYDIRIFIRRNFVSVELSATTSAFHSDLKTLLEWIRLETPVELVDDDGNALAM